MRGALRALREAVEAPRRTGPVTDAIRTMRAALPGFDADPDLRALRRALADRIEADLAVLDMLGGDADSEPSLGAGEPYTVGSAHDWSYGTGDDREEDAGDGPEIEDEHGGDVQDEPHDDDEREAGDDNGLGDADGLLEQSGNRNPAAAWGGFVA